MLEPVERLSIVCVDDDQEWHEEIQQRLKSLQIADLVRYSPYLTTEKLVKFPPSPEPTAILLDIFEKPTSRSVGDTSAVAAFYRNIDIISNSCPNARIHVISNFAEYLELVDRRISSQHEKFELTKDENLKQLIQNIAERSNVSRGTKDAIKNRCTDNVVERKVMAFKLEHIWYPFKTEQTLRFEHGECRLVNEDLKELLPPGDGFSHDEAMEALIRNFHYWATLVTVKQAGELTPQELQMKQAITEIINFEDLRLRNEIYIPHCKGLVIARGLAGINVKWIGGQFDNVESFIPWERTAREVARFEEGTFIDCAIQRTRDRDPTFSIPWATRGEDPNLSREALKQWLESLSGTEELTDDEV
jgi:hypothetical protein